ncbi:MAG TPA: flagellar biosynthetic protein FliO [Candidatus Saccharimonadales bacterium]|nr:flagellar biosynthetic protein FliO [Candidatus Saccharimonadales bacterium]
MNKQNSKNKKTFHQKNSEANVGVAPCAEHEPIDFAQQLRETPGRLPQINSGLTLSGRIYGQFVQRIRQFAKSIFKRQGHRRTLALLETQQLGDKRFVAIVRVGKQKFLIGGGATSVSLLAEITPQRSAIITPRPFAQETA